MRNFDPMQSAEEEYAMRYKGVSFETDADMRNDEGRDSTRGRALSRVSLLIPATGVPLPHPASGRNSASRIQLATPISTPISLLPLPRRLLLRETVQRAEPPHQIDRMDSDDLPPRK